MKILLSNENKQEASRNGSATTSRNREDILNQENLDGTGTDLLSRSEKVPGNTSGSSGAETAVLRARALEELSSSLSQALEAHSTTSTAAVLLERVGVVLSAYNGVVKVSTITAVPDDELSRLTALLVGAKDIRVTVKLLTDRPTVAKSIRLISKEKTNINTESDMDVRRCLMRGLIEAAALVVTTWKGVLAGDGAAKENATEDESKDKENATEDESKDKPEMLCFSAETALQVGDCRVLKTVADTANTNSSSSVARVEKYEEEYEYDVPATTSPTTTTAAPTTSATSSTPTCTDVAETVDEVEVTTSTTATTTTTTTTVEPMEIVDTEGESRE